MPKIEELDRIILWLTNLIWDMDKEELQYVKDNRPSLWKYLLEMDIVKEDDDEETI